MFLKTRIVTGAVAGVLALAMTGATALAAFQPAEAPASAAVHVADTGASGAERGKDTGHLRALEAILGRLVASGTITEEQKTKILEELRSAGAPKDGARLKRIWDSLMGFSVEYLGLTKADVRTALSAGTSLGALADATAGKSRDGLIGAITTGVTGLIDEALADGKITEEQAAAAEAKLLEKVTAFVDRVHEQKPPSDRAKEHKEPAKDLKDRAKQLKERAKDLRERFKERRAERQKPQDEEQAEGD